MGSNKSEMRVGAVDGERVGVLMGKIDMGSGFRCDEGTCLRNDGADATYLHSRSQATTFISQYLQLGGKGWLYARAAQPIDTILGK